MQIAMSTQITVPVLSSRGEYLNLPEKGAPILDLVYDLLSEESTLKKGVDHNPATVIAGANTILGAMTSNGSLESMCPIWSVFSEVLLQQLQRLAKKRGLPAAFQAELAGLCDELRKVHPFAHRTTVQSMLNGHKKESSDQWLGRSFQQSIEELAAAGYKPPGVAINQDPHFADFKPAFKNGEIRQILIGGRTTLKTGYQFNLTNITPIGLYSAIDLVPKRQENGQDLGDLHYAVTFGKAADRARQAALPVVNFQGDRGLEAAGLFVISQQHAWPSAAGEVGALAEFTKDVFLMTPWTSTRQTKADLIAGKDFAEVMVASSSFPRKQYTGDQPLVQAVVGPSPKCKVPVETAILVLQKRGGSYCAFSPAQVQEQLSALQQKVKANETLIESLKSDYFTELRSVNAAYKERGLLMKLNAKSSGRLAGESPSAWAIRTQYNRARRSGKALQRKLDAFLRTFQVFEFGVDEAALELLKGPPCMARSRLVTDLKSCSKAYTSRWCIEAGFETIEYHFPIQYRGPSSDTHLRIYVLQAIVFNSYRVAQIKHVGAAKPHNWRPWDPKMKVHCRQFRAADLRSFSTKTYLLGLLKESLNAFFCRSVS
jgi:hypothetical protein